VTKLKQQPGQAILIYGAGPVAHTLIQHGLVDELRVHLYPLLAGGKVRLLNDASDLPAMKLVDIKVFASGIVILTYQPTRPG
jgi:dihydrofolate reductase